MIILCFWVWCCGVPFWLCYGFWCPEENHDLGQHDKCILIVIVDPLPEPGT